MDSPPKTSFSTTRWSLIGELRHDNPMRRRQALEHLASEYRPAIYGFYRSMGISNDLAEDLTQSFITEKIIGGKLLEGADKKRARLRSLLRTSLKNFRIDVLKRKGARSVSATSLDQIPDDREGSDRDIDSAIAEFDRIWAARILNRAVMNSKEYFERIGRQSDWSAFELRVLAPIRSGNKPPPLSLVAEKAGKRSAAAASHAIYDVKMRLRTEMIAIVASTIADTSSVNSELADLAHLMQV